MRNKSLLRYGIAGVGALGALGAAAYGLFRLRKKSAEKADAAPQHAAFAEGEAGRKDPNAVRNAGPEAMRSDGGDWDAVDEASDESFPSSDPPGNY